MSEALTVRQRKILGILNSQKERISGKEIAEYLGVTDRTVRTEIRYLTDYLRPHGVQIDAIRGKGYLLRYKDTELIQSLVYQKDAMLTTEDRIRTLTMILLESPDPVQLDDLSEECFVSRSTIEHDLRVIAFEYEREQPHIHLIRRRNSVCFEENEWKRRYVMNLLYVRRWNFNYEAGLVMADLPVRPEELTAIEDLLTEEQRTCGIELSENDHVSFLFSIAIALHRIRTGFPIGQFGENGTRESRTAVSQILTGLEKMTGVLFSEDERNALADELALRRQYSDTLFNGHFYEEAENAPFVGIIESVLKETDRELGLAFSDSVLLKSELLHILLTQTRNPYHAGLRDEYVTRRVRAEYPDAVELACRLEEALRKGIGTELTENYLFELVACFAEAIEEQAAGKSADSVRVVIVSHMTIGATKVLMTQIRKFFGSRIRLSGPIPVYEASRTPRLNADLAVSTTKMKVCDDSIPYLTIPRMMDKKNYERMNFLVSLEAYRKLYPGSGRWITDKLEHLEVMRAASTSRSRWELLSLLSEKAVRDGLMGAACVSSIEDRERQTATAFREGFAVPHAIRCGAAKSGLILLHLDNPVDWGGIAVDQVVLFFLSERDLPEQMRILSSLVFILRRLHAQKILSSVADGPALKELLESIEKLG